jgi:serine/threonine-protein kinase
MDQFGKYRVLRRIGAGGFGVVYEGYDPAIRRRVAIKTCTSADPRVRMRFTREAEITGNLSHPNIVVVFDYGEIDGSPYLVQEFLVGEDLDAKIVRRDPMPLGTRLSYLIQIADALAHAHRKGVVHRDVKPSNIRVLENGVIKVMDFGIAWIRNHESITLTGRTVGTAAYMAPEQLRNEPVGPRADIFSFGVLAYELLTSERAFAGDSPSQVLYQVLNVEPLPIRARCPDVPPELAALVAGCHRKDAAERYRSLEAVLPALRQLEALSREDGAMAPPAPPPAPPLPPPLAVDRTRPLAPPVTVDRTRPLAPPPPSAATAGRLDSIELRAPSARRASTAVLAAGAAKRRTVSTPLVATVGLVVLALGVGAALARWEALGRALGSLRAELPSAADDDERTPEAPPPTAADSPRVELAPPQPERKPELGPNTGALPDVPGDRPAASAASPASSPATDAGSSASSTSPPQALPRPRPRPAPSTLTIRARLGAPQGWAWLDDAPLGRTPIRGLSVAPGKHRLRVALQPDGAASAPAWDIRLASGHEHVLTVDPASGLPPHEVRRPATP